MDKIREAEDDEMLLVFQAETRERKMNILRQAGRKPGTANGKKMAVLKR